MTPLRIGQYFLTIYYKAFYFIVVPNLNSNPNNRIEILFISVFQSID